MPTLKIRGRLYLGFGTIVALIIAMTAVSMIYASQVTFAVSEVSRTTTIVEGLKDALLSVRQGRVQAWTYVATGDKSYLAARDEAFAQFDKQYAAVEPHIVSPVGRQLVKDYLDAVVDFEAKAKAMDELRTKTVAISAPEFAAAIDAVNSTAKRYAETNDKAAAFYADASGAASAAAARKMRQSGTVSLAFGAVGGLLGLMVAWRIARGIASPIDAMTAAMTALAAGELDVVIPAAQNTDEIGDMAKAVDVFKCNAVEARRLAAQDAAETAAKAERARRIQNDVGAFDGVARRALDALTGASTELQATARSLAAGATDASSRSTNVAAAAEQASANVATVASASEEMTSSIAEIARQVTRSSEIAAQAVREGAETRGTISGLHDAAQRIGDVVRLINDIASQTNLLALNATIEAARAGDAGKGFAVVASEVKALANQTAKATEEIAGQIKAMQGATVTAVQAIERINSTIDRVAEIATTIASAMEEQSAATQEISRNVQQAAKGTQEVTQNITDINRIVGESSDGSGRVLAAAIGLADQGDLLRGEVAGFLERIRAA